MSENIFKKDSLCEKCDEMVNAFNGISIYKIKRYTDIYWKLIDNEENRLPQESPETKSCT